MKKAVVDASVAAKWVVEEAHSAKAALLLGFDTLYAPNHWRAAAVNVLWAKVFRGDLAATDGAERMAVLMRASVIDTPVAELMPRVFAISVAHSVTIYDSLYLALAEQRDIPLVTADERLVCRIAGDAALGKLMIGVGNLST